MIKSQKNKEIDRIYQSYLKAEKHQDYFDSDKNKRNPQYTNMILDQLGLNYNPINILVTGSKGKGSVSKMISELLLNFNEYIGLFTSPHIEEFNERIQIRNKVISDDDLVESIRKVGTIVEEIDSNIPVNKYVSPIGFLVSIAMLYFSKNNCNINVLECGKGAKYDDVNTLKRDYSVINTIFREHTRELGETIELIAEDKSNIIIEGQKYAYSAKQKDSVIKVIKKRALAQKVELKVYGEDFYADNVTISPKGTTFDVVTRKKRYNNIVLPLLGKHQAENAAIAFQVCEDVIGTFDVELVKHSMKNINWPGRLEIIGHDPVIILDACINKASASSVIDILKLIGAEKIGTIIGVPEDKDYIGISDEMKLISDFIFLTKSSNPHYKFSEKQLDSLNVEIPSAYYSNLKEAVLVAKEKVGEKGVVCILGTTSLITDVKKIKLNND